MISRGISLGHTEALHTAGVTEALEALEAELGITIALMNYSGRQASREGLLDFIARTHVNVERETTVPLAFWASLSPRSHFDRRTIPVGMFQSGERPPVIGDTMADTMIVEQPDPEVESFDYARVERFGEIADRVAVVLYPFLHNFNRDVVEQFKPDPFVEMVRRSVDPELIEQARQRALEHARQQLFSILSARDENEVDRIRGVIDQQEQLVREYSEYLRNAESEARRQQEILDAVLARRQETPITEEYAQREYDAILRHVNVERIAVVNDNAIDVFTGMLPIVHPETGEEAELGRFSIRLDFHANIVRPRNLTNRRGNRDHPHVVDGDFCLGEMQSTLTSLMRERQIAAAVNFVIDALHSVNIRDDWGRYVSWWFEEREVHDEDLVEA